MKIRAQTTDFGVPRIRLYTTDAAPARSRDVRLSAEIAPRNPGMMGVAWTGYSTEQLDRMSDDAVLAVVKDTARGVKRYLDARRAARDQDFVQARNFSSGEMGPGNSGSLSTGADARPEQVFDVGMGAEPSDINDANRAFWNRANSAATRDQRVAQRGSVTPASMNATAAAFWATQPQPRSREWGRG